MQGTQIGHSAIKSIFTGLIFPMLILMEEMKPVVLVKYDFDYREKLKLKGFLWNFRTLRILMQGTKAMIF